MTLRQEKVNALIKEELGLIISREVELPQGCLATIVGVDVSADLKWAKIFISVLPDKYRGSVLEILRKKSNHIRKSLNRRIEIKFSPKLEWVIDATEEHASGIEALLDKIKEEM